MEHNDVNTEIQDITKEAEYLLEQLRGSELVPDKKSNVPEKITHTIECQRNTNASSEKNGRLHNVQPSNTSTIVVVCLLSLSLVVGLILESTNISGTSTSGARERPDDIAGLTKLETESKNSILICELQPILERASTLSLRDQSLVARKKKIISEANKSIAFLDAASAKGNKYWEDPSCTWGQQWFDQHNENSFRAFVAVSKKCIKPKLNYEYTKDKEGKNSAGGGYLNLTGHRIGEISIPYPIDRSYYAIIRNISCS